MITESELRKEYRDLRLKHSLTLRDAANLLGVEASDLCKIEVGSVPLIEKDTSQLIKVICHRCSKKFEAHPLIMDGEPIVFASWVCDECRIQDT